MQRATTLFEQYVKLQQSLNYETIIATVKMDEPAKLSDTIAANLQLGIEEKQELLAIFDPAARLARTRSISTAFSFQAIHPALRARQRKRPDNFKVRRTSLLENRRVQ